MKVGGTVDCTVLYLGLYEYWRPWLYLGEVLGPVGGHTAAHVHETGEVAQSLGAQRGVRYDLLRLHLVPNVAAVVGATLEEPGAGVLLGPPGDEGEVDGLAEDADVVLLRVAF